MKKWYVKWYLGLLIVSTMSLLTGCGGADVVSGIKVNPEHELQPWSVSEATADEAETETLATNPMAITAEDLLLQDEAQADINLISVREVSNDDAEAEATTDGVMSAILSPDKEYEITAQVLLTRTKTMKSEETFVAKLEFPNLLPGRETDWALKAQIYNDAEILLAEDEFQIGALGYDLALEYVLESAELGRVWTGAKTVDYGCALDATWEHTAPPKADVARVSYPITISGEWTTAQYLLRYHVRTTIAGREQAEASEHANNPVRLEFRGFSQGDVLGDDADATSVALTDCLREDYFLPEELSFPEAELSAEEWEQQAVFLVAEVNLPEWAYKEAIKQGLILEQYCRFSSGRENYGMRVILEGYPDNYGTAVAEIVIPQEVAGKQGYALSGAVPVSHLAIWKGADADQLPSELIGLHYLMDPRYDWADDCEIMSYQMPGTEVEQSGGHFYLVIGYGLDFSEGGN